MDSISKHKPQYSNLNAWRFFAFLVVFIYHCCIYFKPRNLQTTDHGYHALLSLLKIDDLGGQIGVAFFFVLSGFLISLLLFKEKEAFGKISIGKFYMRRILRIWPLYYLVLFAGFYLFPMVLQAMKIPLPERSMHLGNYLLFLANFDVIWNGTPPPILGVQWSVAIEEQFYLLWPIVFLVIGKKSGPFIFLLLLLVSFLFGITSENPMRWYHSFTALNYLVIGAMAAYFLSHYTTAVKHFLSSIKGLKMGLVYGMVFLFIGLHKTILEKMHLKYQTITPYLAIVLGVCYAFIIVHQAVSAKEWTKGKAFALLNTLGKWSYGLYLLHMFAIVGVKIVAFKLNWPIDKTLFPLYIALSLLISIGLSAMSYRFFEKPFLNIKEKFSRLK